jgi:hypothetical protein
LAIINENPDGRHPVKVANDDSKLTQRRIGTGGAKQGSSDFLMGDWAAE